MKEAKQFKRWKELLEQIENDKKKELNQKKDSDFLEDNKKQETDRTIRLLAEEKN